MTLKWNQTAHDCRVAEFMAPRVLQHFELLPNRKWRFREESTLFRPVGVMGYLDDLIISLGRELPETKFWDRTRSRLITRHGTYQIRAEVTGYVARGMFCRCWGPCRFPAEADVREPGRTWIPSLPQLTQDQIDEILNS